MVTLRVRSVVGTTLRRYRTYWFYASLYAYRVWNNLPAG